MIFNFVSFARYPFTLLLLREAQSFAKISFRDIIKRKGIE